MSRILFKTTMVLLAILFVHSVYAQNQRIETLTSFGLDKTLLLSFLPSIESTTVDHAMEYVQIKKSAYPEVPIIGLHTNPVIGGIWQIDFDAPADCNSLICLYDNNEQLLVQKIVATEAGPNSFQLNMTECPPGEYLIKVCTIDEVFLGVIAKS